MKAEEMFKELGFIKNKSICYNETNISYEKPIKNEYGECDIETVYFENGYFVYTSTFRTPLKTYGKVLKAIYIQMRELNWVDNIDEVVRFHELEEKATPKKLSKENGVYSCPNCNLAYFDDFYEEEKFDYCPSCGQRLDWGE